MAVDIGVVEWLASYQEIEEQMATYLELRDLATNQDLLGRVQVAMVVAAQTTITNAAVGSPTPPDEQVAFAQHVIRSPEDWAKRILWLVLAANRTLTVTQITTTVTDAQIQTAVDEVMGPLAMGALFSG